MKLTPERLDAFLAAIITTGGNVSRACKAVSITRQTAYEWRSEDLEFAKAWDRAKAIGLDELEDEVLRRAFEGVQRKVYYQGKATRQTIVEYSDTLAIFLLKGGKPEKYRERVEHSGSIGLAEQLAAARERVKAAT